MNKVIINTCFIILLSFVSFSQSVLYKTELEEQIDMATLVVEAKVVEKKSYRSLINDRIYTLNTLTILGIYKGETTNNTIKVITKGGSVDFDREVYKPSLQLKNNEIGLFILKESENRFDAENDNTDQSYYKPVSSLQSFFKYQLITDKVSNPFYSFDSVEEFQELIQDYTYNYSLIEEFKISESKALSSKSLDAPVIRSIAPSSVRAGTGEEISIIGENFGDTQGIVAFRNADDGGFSFFEAYDTAVTSWSDTNIIIRVPSLAGTGNIQIINNDGEATVTDSVLTVLSAEVNAEFEGNGFQEEEYRSKFYNNDDSGGYTWTFNNEFYQNTDAVDAFMRALDTWVCETNISWLISDGLSIVNGTDNDDINLITFKGASDSNIDELEFGVLAVTSTYYTGCIDGDIISYIDEVDITFSSDFTWYYGENETGIADNESDFQGTATHELGHAHNLGHVIAPNNLMHFETDTGEVSTTRDIDEDTSIGAMITYEYAKTPGLCGQKMVYDRECEDETVFNITDNDIRVTVQDDGDLVVLNSKSIVSLGVYDMQGRTIITVPTNQIDISNLSTGIYVLYIEDEFGEITIKKILKP